MSYLAEMQALHRLATPNRYTQPSAKSNNWYAKDYPKPSGTARYNSCPVTHNDCQQNQRLRPNSLVVQALLSPNSIYRHQGTSVCGQTVHPGANQLVNLRGTHNLYLTSSCP